MGKTITMRIEYPWSITALDTEGQFMNVCRRMNDTHKEGGEVSDSDVCTVTSGRNDQNDPQDIQTGTCQWGEAFRSIADFMNCTQLD